MPVGAVIFLGVVLIVFSALDIFMLVTLLKPGDERNQIFEAVRKGIYREISGTPPHLQSLYADKPQEAGGIF